VHLTDPQSSVLLELVSKAPAIVSRDDLARAGWGGAAVTDNNTCAGARSPVEYAGQHGRLFSPRIGGTLFAEIVQHATPGQQAVDTSIDGPKSPVHSTPCAGDFGV
jgi:hypothetical protein